MRKIIVIILTAIGVALLSAGCRLTLTAEKLEASAEIYRYDASIAPSVEKEDG